MGQKLGYCGVRIRMDGRWEAVWDGVVFFVNWDSERVHRHFAASRGQPAGMSSGVSDAIKQV